ncbi:precorrin-6y C5,15-methyltransferase (decarboxylating) subunit CbiE [Corynebacterium epidermidicanis]|uniref:Precorrin-6Y C5,15-methyltransferase (Decarboxylating) n=1 Tax=Corynebacterium epidermidicanis TaxID=1050174 RepID=A0A0G3GUC7_9CORY|nr:precorrin-6y C5,15-methyltransferase (decarboxylating) subunit CbiE [Corynebacterium epidermidicanis]AKK03128.1 precorrin-6Y C5,15-methyltransferase (decarboxylating) [Corynebacterium epidermidicanis]
MTSPAHRPADPPNDPNASHADGASHPPHLAIVDGDADPDFSVSVPYHGVYVIGINPGGFDDLSATARSIIEDADLIIGSTRQLGLIPEHVGAQMKAWPSPLVPAIKEYLKNWRHQNIVVLGSGDPMFHGIGQTLAREFGAENFRVLPAPSSVSLACAELKWPLHGTPVVSLVRAGVEEIVPYLDAGQPFLVLGRDRFTPQAVASLLIDQGHLAAQLVVLSDLGGPQAEVVYATPEAVEQPASGLNVIAVVPDLSRQRSVLPGLPDDAYEHDGQITKSHIRALTVCALEGVPGDLLWDIGGGSGSVAIEFLRATPGAQAVSFERSELRRARIRNNAHRLGVPGLEVAESFPTARPERPTCVFIGGGLTVAGVFEAAWAALIDGGLLVANAVTIQSQALLVDLRAAYGGTLTRIDVSHEHAIGSFTALQPALPVWQWKVRKDSTR